MDQSEGTTRLSARSGTMQTFVAALTLLLCGIASTIALSGNPFALWITSITSILLYVALALALSALLYTQRKLAVAEKQREVSLVAANTDAATGAHSRAFFLSEMQRFMARGVNLPLGYLQLDMDYLKTINDTQGHGAGDAALRHLVDIIRKRLPDAIIGRLGGDEFGVLLVGHENKVALFHLSQRILKDLQSETLIGERPMRLSATIGVAVAPADADQFVDLMSKADLALYHGKRNGRAIVVPYDHEMTSSERYSRNLLRELRGALLLNEIKVYYQPVFAADEKTPKSYEALVRWHHPHRGVVNPADFIPFAERSELIDRIGEAVLRRVCKDLPALGVPAAVNVSPVQLRRPGFAERFLDLLLEHGVSPRSLVLEVTEGVLMKANGIETQNLASLRRAGVRVAIDDLGTGHASLEYLRTFAFDAIKIDRSYTANVTMDGVDRVIVSALCDVGRVLGVDVVAEGVETDAQLAVLRNLGCPSYQGYLFGRPMPLEAILFRRAIEPAA